MLTRPSTVSCWVGPGLESKPNRTRKVVNPDIYGFFCLCYTRDFVIVFLQLFVEHFLVFVFSCCKHVSVPTKLEPSFELSFTMVDCKKKNLKKRMIALFNCFFKTF